jgi:hypothetical protein
MVPKERDQSMRARQIDLTRCPVSIVGVVMRLEVPRLVGAAPA